MPTGRCKRKANANVYAIECVCYSARNNQGTTRDLNYIIQFIATDIACTLYFRWSTEFRRIRLRMVVLDCVPLDCVVLEHVALDSRPVR